MLVLLVQLNQIALVIARVLRFQFIFEQIRGVFFGVCLFSPIWSFLEHPFRVHSILSFSDY